MGTRLTTPEKSQPQTPYPLFAEMVKQVGLPVSPNEDSNESWQLNRYVKQALTHSFLPKNYDTQQGVCVYVNCLLQQVKNLSQDENADYQESCLRWLRSQSANGRCYDTRNRHEVLVRNVPSYYRNQASRWYTNQFWAHCEVEPQKANGDFEKELFCLSRSLKPQFKKVDVVCDRLYEDYDATKLKDALRWKHWSTTEEDQKVSSVIEQLVKGELKLRPFVE